MEKIKLIARGSRLSLLQVEIVKQRIKAFFPGLDVEVIVRRSKGDDLQDIPLHTVEGSDFFTREIFNALKTGEADIAVHSLKDMSSEHFFGKNKFAVVDRDDNRDVAIFNNDVEEKIKNGDPIIVGTCSPRREEMGMAFLKNALPQHHTEIKIVTKPIRGNVETRLRKLSSGEYDATILATAGLNRLLKNSHVNLPLDEKLTEATVNENNETTAATIKDLLADKKLMLLPLIECVPAPCQGAIVAEAHPSNKKAVEVLQKINDEELLSDCYAEKEEAAKYGAGCIQKFGVAFIYTKNGKFLYAAGKDSEGTEFVKWNPLPTIQISEEKLFSSTDRMKDFFEYEWCDKEIITDKSVVFVANYKSLAKCSAGLLQYKSATQQKFNSSNVADLKIILVSGTKTWFELAKQGYWVTASADALGFEFLLPSLQMPLLDIKPDDICLLTHESAAARWKKKGYHAISSYKLLPRNNEEIMKSISDADSIFWSSYSQYEFYGQYARPGAKHICAGGETAELLKQAGINPVIFPTLKSFQQWKNFSIPSLNAGLEQTHI